MNAQPLVTPRDTSILGKGRHETLVRYAATKPCWREVVAIATDVRDPYNPLGTVWTRYEVKLRTEGSGVEFNARSEADARKLAELLHTSELMEIYASPEEDA